MKITLRLNNGMFKMIVYIIMFGLLVLYASPSRSEEKKGPGIFGYINAGLNVSDGEKLDMSIPRVRIGTTGKIHKKLSYFIIAEGGDYSPKGASTFSLIDAYITYHFHNLLNVSIGQDFYKFTYEGSTIAPKQLFINKSEIVFDVWDSMGRNGFYAEDVGIWINGFSEKHSKLNYNLSITNGTGLGYAEDNKLKDYCLRVTISPILNFIMGASIFQGYSRIENEDVKDNAMGVELVFNNDKVLILSEYIVAKYLESANEPQNYPQVSKLGWYLTVGYRVDSRLMILIRHAYYENEIGSSINNYNNSTLGLSYSFRDFTNLKINYSFIENDSDTYHKVFIQSQIVF